MSWRNVVIGIQIASSRNAHILIFIAGVGIIFSE